MKLQRGFTVPELLMAMLLFIALGVTTLGMLHGFVRTLDKRSTAQNGVLTLEQQIARMRSDSSTAFAVFVPQKDVFGQLNGGGTAGAPTHEVAFYTKTDTNTETWWAYHYDAVARSLQRYDFDPANPRLVGVFNRNTGVIDATAQYPPLLGVNAFSATSVQANELTNPQHNAFAPVISGLMSGKTPIGDPVGFVPMSGKQRDDLYGGNASVSITMATDHGNREIHLVSGAMASGFTIHEAVAMRSFVYRMNTHHRSWFGLVSKSRAHVYVQLQYNVKPSDPTSPWQIGCDYEIYGNGAGMDFADHLAGFRPDLLQETTADSFFVVTHDRFQGQNPIHCDSKIPTVNDTPQPLFTAAPIVIDTPPACFSGSNPCWPYNAPPNWSPPSPWPSISPPPDWCAGHQASMLCGGDGNGPTPSPNPGNTVPPVQLSPSPTPRVTNTPSQDPTQKPIRGPGHGIL